MRTGDERGFQSTLGGGVGFSTEHEGADSSSSNSPGGVSSSGGGGVGDPDKLSSRNVVAGVLSATSSNAADDGGGRTGNSADAGRGISLRSSGVAIGGESLPERGSLSSRGGFCRLKGWWVRRKLPLHQRLQRRHPGEISGTRISEAKISETRMSETGISEKATSVSTTADAYATTPWRGGSPPSLPRKADGKIGTTFPPSVDAFSVEHAAAKKKMDSLVMMAVVRVVLVRWMPSPKLELKQAWRRAVSRS